MKNFNSMSVRSIQDYESNSSNEFSQFSTSNHTSAFHQVNAALNHVQKIIDFSTLIQLVESKKNSLKKNAVLNTDQKIDLANVLREQGYSAKIQHVSFTESNAEVFKQLHIEGIHFEKCTWDWSHFSGSTLKNSSFKECQLTGVSFLDASLNQVNFVGCKLLDVLFVNSKIHRSLFDHSDVLTCSFEGAIIHFSDFKSTDLNESYFLDSIVHQTNIQKTNLENVVFFGNQENFKMDEASKKTAKRTKRVAATLVFPESKGVTTPRVVQKIREESGLVCVRLALNNSKFSPLHVDQEIERGFKQSQHREGGRLHAALGTCFEGLDKSFHSLGQQWTYTIHDQPNNYPNAHQILNWAKRVGKSVDAIVLPGGEDLPPSLYGEEKSPHSQWNKDYRRTLMELGLIDYAYRRSVPLMGICRGFQAICVYFGAKLHQHIGNQQVGVRVLNRMSSADSKPSEASKTEGAVALCEQPSIYGNILRGIRTAVYHHQAVQVNVPMTHLSIAFERKISNSKDTDQPVSIVMAVDKKHAAGAPVLGVQFHPEFYEPSASTSQPNLDNSAFIRLAKQYKNEQRQRGLHTPQDLLKSRITQYMSPENDIIWKILKDCSQARDQTRSISSASLKAVRLKAVASKASALNAMVSEALVSKASGGRGSTVVNVKTAWISKKRRVNPSVSSDELSSTKKTRR